MDNTQVEALKRRLKIGVRKKRKIEVKRARRDMPTYVWKEEAAENGGEGYDEEQKERRAKKTKTQGTERDQHGKTVDKGSHKDTERESEEARSGTWDTRIVVKGKANEALIEMGFDEKSDLSSREARTRKRTEYKKSQEEFEYPEKSSQGIKHTKEENIKRPKEKHKGTQNENDRNY